MIVTLTLNPAVDKSTEIDRLVPEKKMRCPQMLIDAGGGGINVSKAIAELGGDSIAVYTCGGINGQLLTGLLLEKNIVVKPVQVPDNTRENFVVTETLSNKQYRFVMPGPTLSPVVLEAVRKAVLEIDNVGFLVCSGSLPPGVPASFIGELAAAARDRGLRFVTDTSGDALKAAMQSGVFLVKPNMTELCSLAGTDYLHHGEIEDAARAVVRSGACEVLVVSMGPAGALLATKDVVRTYAAPVVKKTSTVGAGDSMVAGLVWMLEQGERLEDAVRFGIACGTAATVNKGTQLFKKGDALRFYQWLQKKSIPAMEVHV